MPSNRKKWGKKSEKRGEEGKQKVKVKTTIYLKISLSAHARTSQANILHLDQKAAKCTQLASKRVFFGKISGRMGNRLK